VLGKVPAAESVMHAVMHSRWHDLDMVPPCHNNPWG